ncbi:hypothetical protein BH20ACI3_BH20ACI3_18800 [soil metagenome]
MDYLRDTHRSLSTEAKAEFDSRFGNAWVEVRLRPSISLRRRKQIAERILDQMMKLDPRFEGTFSMDEMGTKVASVLVKRRDGLAGPHFKVPAVAHYDPIPLDRLQAKFEKEYKSHAPIDLLAYYYTQEAPLDEQLRELFHFIDSHMAGACFTRTWVFNVTDRRICYP